VNNVIPLYTMSIATKRLSLQVIPEGVVQSFVADRQTSQAKSVAPLELVKMISNELEMDGAAELRALADEVSKLHADPETEVIVSPINNSQNKHFTV